jgi:hypothetical protein
MLICGRRGQKGTKPAPGGCRRRRQGGIGPAVAQPPRPYMGMMPDCIKIGCITTQDHIGVRGKAPYRGPNRLAGVLGRGSLNVKEAWLMRSLNSGFTRLNRVT